MSASTAPKKRSDRLTTEVSDLTDIYSVKRKERGTKYQGYYRKRKSVEDSNRDISEEAESYRDGRRRHVLETKHPLVAKENPRVAKEMAVEATFSFRPLITRWSKLMDLPCLQVTSQHSSTDPVRLGFLTKISYFLPSN